MLHSNRIKILLLTLILLVLANSAWAGHPTTYYSQLKAQVSSASPTGSGKVYAATSNTATPTYSDSSTSDTQSSSTENESKTFYAFAQSESGYLFKGWSSADNSTTIASTSNPYSVNIQCSSSSSSSPTTKTVYAVFALIPPTTITYTAPTNGTYTATYSDATITMNPGSANQSKQSKETVKLTATPAEGYKFLRYVKVVNGVKSGCAFEATASLSFTEDATVYAEFIPDSAAVFSVNGTLFSDLNEANTFAVSTSAKTIVVVQDGTLAAGNYTISSGITLVVPYEATGTIAITAPVKDKSVLSNSTFNIKAFRTLKLAAGANITVNGAISVTAELQSGDASHNPTGFPCRYTGVLDMSEGGHIDLNSGATLYAWGFVRGQGYLQGNNTTNVGTITAKSGSTVKECYGLGDWGGGTYTVAVGLNSKSYRIFPFQNYFVQNVEVPLRIEYGAAESLYTNVYGKDSQNEITDIPFIGNTDGALFRMSTSGSAVTKWYDPTTDRLMLEIEGNAKLDNLKMTVLSYSIQASDFDLPLPSNISIKLKNCNLSVVSPVKMQAGSVMEIPAGSSLTLESKLFVYDHDDWGMYVLKKYFVSLPTIPTPYRSRGDGKTNTLDDARILCDGAINISSGGGLYTTPNGADIMGNHGGTITWSSTLPDAAVTYGYTNGNSVDAKGFFNLESTLTDAYIVTTTCPPAWMHNNNNTYTHPTGNTTFYNIHGRWFGGTAANEKADHTYDFTYINGSTDVTTDAIYWTDISNTSQWNNATTNGVTYLNTWIGTEEEAGVTAYYCYTTYIEGVAQQGWVRLTQIGTSGNYGGSDNHIYTYLDDKWQSLGSTDSECLYTLNGERKALVGDTLIAITKNITPEDGAWHATDNTNQYYVDLSSGYCQWTPATKVTDVEKAYIIEGQTYIRYDADGTGEDWLPVSQETPYYYTLDNQGQRTYYEYNATDVKWQLATPKVKVTAQKGVSKQYYFLTDAMSEANAFLNPTVTLLADVAQTLTTNLSISSAVNSTSYIFDLNGHTATLTRSVSGTNINVSTRFFLISSSGTAVTIKDGSASQTGAIICKAQGNGYATGIHIAAGTLTLESGKLYVENSSVHSANTNARAYGVYSAAGTTFNMIGGTLETASEYYSYAIIGVGTIETIYAKTTPSHVNITGGTIQANAYQDARGIFSTGYINVSDGTINATTQPMFSLTKGNSTAYGIFVNSAPNSSVADAFHGKLTLTGGTINATTATSNAYGIYIQGSATTCTARTDYANVASAEAVIDGGMINATAKTTTAYGVYVKGGHNTTDYSKEANVKTVINKLTVNVTASSTAYGIFAAAEIDDYHAGTKYGIVEINDCNVTATTTTSEKAYGVYVAGTTKMLNDTTYTQISVNNKKSWYTDNISGTVNNTYKYQSGYYGTGAKVTINGGTFTATTKTYNAYGAYCSGSYLAGGDVDATIKVQGQGNLTIHGGTFTAVTQGTPYDYNPKSTDKSSANAYGVYSSGITVIDGGTFSANAYVNNAYGAYANVGTMNISKGAFNAIANNANAYGICAAGWIDTKSGIHSHAVVTVDDATVTVQTKTGANAFGAYAIATNAELTQAKYDGLSANDKKYYFTETSSATLAPYYRYRIGTYTEGGELIINGGTFNVETATTTALGASATTSSLVRTTEVGRVCYGEGKLTINGGIFTSKSGTKNAECVRSYGNTTINGGTFTATATTTTAMGVRVIGGKTTVTAGTFNAIATTNTAYGVYVTGEISSSQYGYKQEGELIINGGTFNTETKGGSTAYGAYATGASWSGTPSKVTGASAMSLVAVGTLTITDGVFSTKASNNNTVYGINLSGTITKNTVSASPKATILGGFFNINGATTNSAAINTSATAANCSITAGHFSNKTNLDKYIPSPLHAGNCNEPQYMDTYPYEVNDYYTLTWDAAGGTLSGTYTSGEVQYGASIVAPTVDARTGYEFVGWDKTIAATMPAESITYTAVWNEIVGSPLDIISWTADSLTINASGFTLSGWPYTVNGISYGRENATTTPKCSADRTITIPYTGKPDEELVIKVTNKDGSVYNSNTYIIPHVYTADAVLSGTTANSVVYVNKGNLTINAATSLSAIYVAPAAELTVDAALTVDNLYLRTNAWEAAILQNNSTITATHVYYTRIVADKSQYYQFALPLASNINDVTLSNGKPCPYSNAWLLKSYSESLRANQGVINTAATSNWVMLDATTGTIEATQGYELYSNSAFYREFYFPVTLPTTKTTELSVTHTDGTAGTAHAGWNALCSPLLGKYTQTFADISEAIKVSKLLPSGLYLQYIPEVIYPAVPFYYQAPQTGTLDFSGTELVQRAPRYTVHSSLSTQWLRLMLQDSVGNRLDETSIFTHPDKFTLDYETGYDVAKQSLQSTSAVLYSQLACGSLAFAALPDSVAVTSIPITVYAAQEENYTFHLADNDYLDRLEYVFLQDTETGALIDLLSSDYEALLRSGSTTNRFYISCVFSHEQDITTDIDNTTLSPSESEVQKILYNDHIYILRNGEVYDVTGRQCKMR